MASQTRQANIEALRIVSMLMIVCLHIMNHGGLLDTVVPNTVNYYLFWVLEIFSYVAVNVYVLISGYFLIQSKFSLKKLCATLLELLFYTIGFYALFVLTGRIPFSVKGLVLALLPIKEYWFIRIYLGLYCLSPVLNMALLKLSRREWQLVIAVELLLFSLFLPSTILTVNGSGISWFVTLYTIAGYVHIYGVPQERSAGKYIAGYALTMALCSVLVLAGEAVGVSFLTGILLRYNGALIWSGALLLFLGFLRLPNPSGKWASFLNMVGGCTFGVYLLHENSYVRPFLWENLLHTTQYANRPLAIGIVLLIVCGVFAVCVLLDWVRGWLFHPLLHSKGFSAIDTQFIALVQKINIKYSPKKND